MSLITPENQIVKVRPRSMKRKDWNPQQLAVIQQYESVPIRVVGYLVKISPQDGNQEGTNCGFQLSGDVDTHLALVGSFGMSEAQSVVIEWTPRFLKAHPIWTKAKLSPWVNANKQVRISGWLMFDPNHSNHIGTHRHTLGNSPDH